MSNQSDKASKQFRFQKGKMLFWRLGGINSVKQTHWGLMKDYGWPTGLSLTHQPPVKRGLWCFPAGLQDYFFAWEQWKKRLPKHLTDENIAKVEDDEENARLWKEQEETIKRIQRDNPPSTFWYGGGLYSHISIHGQVGYNEWYWWDNPKEWSRQARKHIVVLERFNGKVYTMNYARDHLEVFIPNF